MSTNYFQEAYADYKYLREKGYPEKAALNLIGNRHRLTRMERNGIFRGVVIASVATERRERLVSPEDVAGRSLGIDWYNVLITVESYLRGMPVFIADDGVLRDCAATHGGYRRATLTDRAMREIFAVLKAVSPAGIEIHLDAPIPFSGLMAEEVRHYLREIPCSSQTSLSHSADYHLKSFAGIVSSSDSVIMDSAARIFDLPRCVLLRSFGFTPPLLPDAFPSAPEEPSRWSGSESPDR
jgi:hypothetical protein